MAAKKYRPPRHLRPPLHHLLARPAQGAPRLFSHLGLQGPPLRHQPPVQSPIAQSCLLANLLASLHEGEHLVPRLPLTSVRSGKSPATPPQASFRQFARTVRSPQEIAPEDADVQHKCPAFLSIRRTMLEAASLPVIAV